MSSVDVAEREKELERAIHNVMRCMQQNNIQGRVVAGKQKLGAGALYLEADGTWASCMPSATIRFVDQSMDFILKWFLLVTGSQYKYGQDFLRVRTASITRLTRYLTNAVLVLEEDVLQSKVPSGIYRHFKGKKYQVLGICRDSETMREKVVYRALYGARGLWLRSPEMFLEQVWVNEMRVPRFQRIK